MLFSHKIKRDKSELLFHVEVKDQKVSYYGTINENKIFYGSGMQSKDVVLYTKPIISKTIMTLEEIKEIYPDEYKKGREDAKELMRVLMRMK